MAHSPISILTIAVALWITDLGFSQHTHAPGDRSALACHEQTQSPGSDGSDLEIVVCANPSR
ncbi:MAG TPA: hypothetical protein VGI10_24220 [Polyangiaceae bacterium]|jgi:hypothetical protein